MKEVLSTRPTDGPSMTSTYFPAHPTGTGLGFVIILRLSPLLMPNFDINSCRGNRGTWSASGDSEDENGPDLQRAVIMDSATHDDEEVDRTKNLVVAEIKVAVPGEEGENTVECVPP